VTFSQVQVDSGDDGGTAPVFDENDVTWDCVSWEMIKDDGLLMVVCGKLYDEALYLARHHFRQQQQHNCNAEPNMFPPWIFSESAAKKAPSNAVAYRICIANRIVAIAAPFSTVIPSALSYSAAPPSPVVAYLAASCARSRDLSELIALLSCDADVFGSMAALNMLLDADASADTDFVASDDGGECTQQADELISDGDKRWLLCAASAWALDARSSADDSDTGGSSSNYTGGSSSNYTGGSSSNYTGGSSYSIIEACLQSSDILNDICALPSLTIEVRLPFPRHESLNTTPVILMSRFIALNPCLTVSLSPCLNA
jgi:hypothetical protein